MIGLLFLVKSEQFGSLKRKIAYIFTNAVVNIAVVLLMSNFVHGLVYPQKDNIEITTYKNLRPGFDVNPDKQIQKILEQPIDFVVNLTIESVRTINVSLHTWIGFFGWESGFPNGMEILFMVLLLLTALFYDYKFATWERCFLPLLALSLSGLFLLSQHIHWGGVGDKILNEFLGKYFVPIFPLYFWSITGLLSNFMNKNNRLRLYFNTLVVIAFVAIYVDFWILFKLLENIFSNFWDCKLFVGLRQYAKDYSKSIKAR